MVNIAIESAGVPKTLQLAFEVTRMGGSTIASGLPNPERKVKISHFILGAQERKLQGSYMGSCISSRDVLRFLEMYKRGQLAINNLASETVQLYDLNEAFDRRAEGSTLRKVMVR